MLQVLSFLRSAVLFLLLAGAGYFAWYTNTTCHVPMSYRLESVDERFGLSRTELLQAIEQAAGVWEKAAGKDLFVYEEEGSLPINLVYDARQAITQKNNELKDSVDATTETAESVKAQYDIAQASYDRLKSAYASAQATYASNLSAYNAKVAYWNARGGAPSSEYRTLQSQKAALEAEARALENKRVALNTQANQVNALSAQYNQLAAKVNTTVDKINQTAGREFEEGLYTRNFLGAKIDIYEYSSKEKLVRVLTHELGHALGLEHNANPEAIMYELNQSENLVPTKEDLAELALRCNLQ